jgi:hypothetical protein
MGINQINKKVKINKFKRDIKYYLKKLKKYKKKNNRLISLLNNSKPKCLN